MTTGAIVPQLMIVGGHRTNMCLFLATTGKDKIQVLEVSNQMCVSPLTPSTVCRIAEGKLAASVAALPRQNVKSLPSEIVEEFRSIARGARANALVIEG